LSRASRSFCWIARLISGAMLTSEYILGWLVGD
jgi:hypothetical protein